MRLLLVRSARRNQRVDTRGMADLGDICTVMRVSRGMPSFRISCLSGHHADELIWEITVAWPRACLRIDYSGRDQEPPRVTATECRLTRTTVR
jgi:hypothetical protein